MTPLDDADRPVIRADGDRSVALAEVTNSVIATGDRNVILHVGDDRGVLMDLLRAAQVPSVRLRPIPLRSCPPASADCLDRDAETAEVVAQLDANRSVNIYGAAGVGKTYVLRAAANAADLSIRPEGIVHVNGKGLRLDDMLQLLFEEFFECEPPCKPSTPALRSDLRARRALIAIDACALGREDLQELTGTVPDCALVVASHERVLWGHTPCFVQGLAPDVALVLVERELARAVSGPERATARTLCALLGGHPLRILQVVAPVREGRLNLDEIVTALASASAADTEAMRIALDGLGDADQAVLRVLAALDGARLGLEHLETLTGLSDASAAVAALERRHLVATHSPSASLLGELPDDMVDSWDLEAERERVLAHLTEWAEATVATEHHVQQHVDHADALLTTLDWAAATGRARDTIRLGRAIDASFCVARRWGMWGAVLRNVNAAAVVLGNEPVEAWSLHQLGSRAGALGDAAQATQQLEASLAIRTRLGDTHGAASTRHNLELVGRSPTVLGRFLQRLRTLPRPVLLVAAVLLVALAAGVFVVASSADDPSPVPPFRLAVTAAGTGSGTVTSEPEGISCGSGATTCSAEFDGNSDVTLTARPGPEAILAGWAGAECRSATADVCIVTLRTPLDVTATFEPKDSQPTVVKLTVVVQGNGQGSVVSAPAGIDCTGACSAELVLNTEVTLTATARARSLFAGWTGPCAPASATSCRIVLGDAMTITADFVPALVLNASVQGTGRVRIEPGGTVCDRACAVDLPRDAELTLTAEPGVDFAFAAWNGPCTGTASTNPCRFTLAHSTKVAARFGALPRLTVTVEPPLGGSVTSSPTGIDCGGGATSCTAAFPARSSVSLTAQPAPDHYRAWGPMCKDESAPTCTVKLAEDGDTADTLVTVDFPNDVE